MKQVIDAFHQLYYDSRVWGQTRWMGVNCLKTPLDLWVYQEIVWETRPDLIVETGTADGGSALYLAHILDLVDHGRVVSIDLQERERPHHLRITYMQGRSSVDSGVLGDVAAIARSSNRTMVILDSDHSKLHVLAELRAYSAFVSVGQYLVVEDTNVNGHPAYPDFGEGPWEAVGEFLQGQKAFEIDPAREKFFLTINPNGFLKRVK
jgi:cephalosporin hydroxylase